MSLARGKEMAASTQITRPGLLALLGTASSRTTRNASVLRWWPAGLLKRRRTEDERSLEARSGLRQLLKLPVVVEGFDRRCLGNAKAGARYPRVLCTRS